MDTRQSYYFRFRVLPPQASLHVIRLYFHGIFIGPYLDFSEYMELINETRFRNAQVKARVKPGHRLPPGRVRAAFTKMFFGLLYHAAFLLNNGKYNYHVALKPEFMKHSLLMRFAIYLFFLMYQGCKIALCF